MREQALSNTRDVNVTEGNSAIRNKTAYVFALWPYNHTSRNLAQKCPCKNVKKM